MTNTVPKGMLFPDAFVATLPLAMPEAFYLQREGSILSPRQVIRYYKLADILDL
jgi:hypothetical protein